MTSPPSRSSDGSAPLDSTASATGASSAFSDRVRLYLKVTTFINALLSIVTISFDLTGLSPDASQVGPARILLVIAVTSTNAMAWFAIARSRHTVRTALLTEAGVTLMLTATYSYVMLALNQAPERADVLVAILLMTIILVLRAAFIPSPTAATAVAGLMSMSCVIALAIYELPHLDFIFHFWHGVMATVVVVVTTVATHTIYGLHRQMRLAQQLGQYQLEHRVGAGGMGEVYLANHSMLQRPTAIKLLRDVTSAKARARFRQEVQTASGLTHPNTVEIYDYGRTPDGVFYFAMEYVEGASLDVIVNATGAMPPARVVHLLEQAAGSLREAHDRGLVHRDIKPANLMICERGGEADTLKVMDFGLVRDLADEEGEGAGALTGTPLYMAPEAILDANGYTPESDIYQLGATAYFLLTGEPPFPAAGLVEVLSDHLATAPPRPECGDEALADLVVRCLSKEPSARPGHGGALLDALEGCGSSGEWRSEDARIWWAEHREQVEAARASDAVSAGSRADRYLARRTATSSAG